MASRYLRLYILQLIIWLVYRILAGIFWCLNHPTKLSYFFTGKLFQFLLTDVTVSLLIVLLYYFSKKYAQRTYRKAISLFSSILISFIAYFCIVSFYFQYIYIVDYHSVSLRHFIFAGNYYWLLFIILNVSNYVYDFWINYKEEKLKNSMLLITIKEHQESRKYDSRIYLSNRTGDNYILVSSIKFIQADTYISKVYMNNNKRIAVNLSLKEWENKLPKDKFFRIHKSYIVNLAFVDRISKLPNQTFEMYIKDQKSPLIMSRRLGKKFVSGAKV